MRLLFTAHVLLLTALAASAQNVDKPMLIGPGIGIDHGGLGARLDVQLTRHVGITAGAGYNLAGVGWNLGAVARLRAEHRLRPYATALYGYNFALRLNDVYGRYASGTNYYGPSFGGGVELWSNGGGRFLHFGLLVPIRTDEARSWAAFYDAPIWPVLVTCGVHL
jgi:hypothetical protein